MTNCKIDVISTFGGLTFSYFYQERQRVIYDEQKKLAQQKAQAKAEMARYEDELARKRLHVFFNSSVINSFCLYVFYFLY